MAETSPEPRQISLRVAEAQIDDVGKGMARLDLADLHRIGAFPGDIIQILGKRSTAAKASPLPPEWRGRGIVQIDGVTRENAGVGRDEKVTVTKATHAQADQIALTPLDATLAPPTPPEVALIGRQLVGYPVTRGDKVQVASFGARGRFFSVQSTTPGGVVVITQHTAIRINPPDIVPERSAFRISYEDVGGLEKELLRVREMIELPMKYPDLFAQLGIEAPKGVLLHGPPGTGKTLIARAVASEIAAHFIHINGPEIIHKYYGESEAKLREKFEEATRNAPSIIFIDEIDAIAPRRAEVVGDVEKRVVAQLLALMDGLVTRGQVVVIGATNIPEILDPALRRPGRFDREVTIGVPNRIARQAILQIHTKYMPLAPSVDLERLANITHGYVGADMEALCKEAGMVALRRILPRIQADESYRPFETKLDIQVTMEDFLEAFKEIEPTATREFLAERPTTRFEHVGGLREVKQTLRSIIELPMTHAGLFDQIGMEPPRGILFSGPSGTGKSLLAKALAGEYQLTFISVDGPALFSKWLGESEKALREAFRKAKHTAPCVLFFDELDSIAPVRREASVESGVPQRMVSQLLRELDGLKDFRDVIFLAATNRIDLIDQALMRAGRFDYILEFPLPDRPDREEILRIHTRGLRLGEDVNLAELADATDGCAGAEIEALCKKAVISAIEEFLRSEASQRKEYAEFRIRARYFKEALELIRRAARPRPLA